MLILHRVWNARREARARTQRLIAIGICALAALSAWLTLSALAPEGWPTSERQRGLAANLSAIGELPADAPLYGTGWYSHPTIALYAGRHVKDINKTTPATLASHSPVYLLDDPLTRRAGRGGYWLSAIRIGWSPIPTT